MAESLPYAMVKFMKSAKLLLICSTLIAGIGMIGCGKKNKTDVLHRISEESEFLGISCVILDGEEEFKEEEVMELYKAMQQDGKEKGYVPIIIYGDEDMKDTIEWGMKEYGSYEAMANYYLDSYKSIEVEQFFSERYKEYEEEGEFDFSWLEDVIEEYPDASMDFGGVTETEKNEELSLYGAAKVYILKVPVAQPYEVLAYYPMGGFNSCPLTEELMAVAKKWYELYGAVPCAVSRDTLQFYLEKPIKEEDIVSTVANESYMMCSDIVSQGTMTLENLKKSIKGSNCWYFWWD